MSFNRNRRLDPSQVEDRRGRRGAGTVIAAGGGGLGLIITIVILLLGGNFTGSSIPDTGQVPYATENAGGIGDLQTQCQSGADAMNREDCRIVGYVNSIQSFWSDEFARNGSQYTEADTVLFTGSTDAACGTADSAMGPFYCPSDQKVYLDLDFFNELQTRFGAQGGSFAEAYVLAHEYGHHVQDLLGATVEQLQRHRAGERVRSNGAPGGLPGRRLGLPCRRNRLPDTGDRSGYRPGPGRRRCGGR